MRADRNPPRAGWRLLLFPAYTAAFLLVAWLTGGPALVTAMTGDAVDGRVVAILRSTPDRCDLLANRRQVLVLERADGTVVEARQEEDAWVSLDLTPPGDATDADSVEADREAVTNQLTMLAGAHRDAIRRFLQREAANEEPFRVVRVERREILDLVPGVVLPLASVSVGDGRVREVIDAAGDRRGLGDASVLETAMTFRYIGGTEEAEERKTSIDQTWSRTVDGAPVAASAEDFCFHEEDFRIDFRPIVAYERSDGTAAEVAGIGARRSPRNDHRLYESIRVATRERTGAVLLPDFNRLKELSPLDQLNFLFEATFGRWFLPAVSLVLALAYAVLAVILLSLALRPPVTENADTVDEEALAREG